MRLLGTVLLFAAGCGGSAVNSEQDAALAYTGLDGMVERAMGLGFDGFNSASSANIDDQSGEGDISGSIVVGGQVDQGASDNKGMRLWVTLDDYADQVLLRDDSEEELEVSYWADDESSVSLELQLKSIPTGTFDGTLVGDFEMLGDLEGDITLDLVIDGTLEVDPDVTDGTRRVSGSTTVTGTATSGYGVYDVDVTL